jgi:poly-gamma-glutamate synthesis protein (capsule biosynthesis protein)
MKNADKSSLDSGQAVRLFLCGDVMTGRGIDQVLPHPGDPKIHEDYLKSALGYVKIAEDINGPVPAPVEFAYIWGEALEKLEDFVPDLRIINLETSVTTSDEFWPSKGINYRMHPDNLPVISAAGIDCCVLANNHVLDWGYAGLEETLSVLHKAGLQTAGAGLNLEQARAPAIFEAGGKGRVIVLSAASVTSGVPVAWAATNDRAGVNLISDFSRGTVAGIAEQVRGFKRPGDIVVFSIHWGSNWGYEIPADQRIFAHHLIDEAGIDAIHGHSSHHPRGVEVYRGRPVMYGCGDFINDYEGIIGHEAFRDDLCLMYFLTIDPTDGKLLQLEMLPQQIRNFRLNPVSKQDVRWLRDNLHTQGKMLGSAVVAGEAGRLELRW